ncbi:polysaccharide biosynthesis tyrosine autokinase [Demequina zhanjiangensis]|uniref:non-specific protein-tyrosine kinase n=1 Tax=Demequina zhanjiangensis TaxID=3051659 RepID=A0ABT8FZ84_9MICO|nr:polysaccharide biosynthesis tyrosine autokinase [Demequina sp. SYSU T00b26]MDN4472029.1 polysaccharide biosynthesis tyrosine autokinase [Demequina sp. SYSU T00b26]
MELQDYIRILRKNWILIAVTFALAVAAAFTYTAVTPPTYTSSSKVFVSTSGASSASELQSGSSFTLARVATYADLATTQSVLGPTIDSLGLADTSVDDLRSQVSASAPSSKSVIDITVTDEDPALATAIATEVATQLAVVVEELETTDSTDGSPVRLSIVQEAQEPTIPSAPNMRLNLALGGLLGLALGLGLALTRAALDTRVHNEKDVELITEVPILGGIVFDPKAKQRPLVIQADPKSPRSESFRTLRTNLQFLDAGRAERAFVLTSSMPAEGKSTTAANLAIALAESGSRVLLVDADLRKPTVHKYLSLEGGVGLTDVIIGRVAPADVIQRWGNGNLYVLAAGQIPPNPSELLGSTAMERLIEQLTSQFDVVLFDAPPLLPVTDAAVLARLVGGSLVIVAAGRTRTNQLEASMDALEVVGAPRSGVVLTMVPTSGPDSYGYGRYGYAYEEIPGAKPTPAARHHAR